MIRWVAFCSEKIETSEPGHSACLQRVKTAPEPALASLNSSVGSIFVAFGDEPGSKISRLKLIYHNGGKRAKKAADAASIIERTFLIVPFQVPAAVHHGA